MEDKYLMRRKKKHRTMPSSLLRATIKEYGIYDREVDAYKTQFVKQFEFLDNWHRIFSNNNSSENNNSIQNDKGDKDGGGNNGGGKVGEVSGNSGVLKVNGNGQHNQQFIQEYAPVMPLGRDLSLEEELEYRLHRMTSIANDLRAMRDKERERRIMFSNEVFECREKCVTLVNDMTLHFQKETELLQHRMLENDGTIEMLNQDKLAMRQAFDEMLNNANKTVEIMESDLKIQKKQVQGLAEDLCKVRASSSSLEEENVAFREEAEELHATIKDLRIKVESLENQLQASELSREHYEALLDISLDKLRLLEYGEIISKKNNTQKMRQKRLILDRSTSSSSSAGATSSSHALTPPIVFPRRTKSAECADMRRKKKDLNSLSIKPRLSSDSQSMTSFETGSEHSGGGGSGSQQLSSQQDTLQVLTADDRISTSSSLTRSNTLGIPSPKACSRKKSKKKTFFSKAFQRKNNPVVETQVTVTGATLGEQLPTICDEQPTEHKGSQLSLSVFRDQEHSTFVKSFDASLLESGNEYKEENKAESLLQRGRCHSVDDLESYIDLDESKTDGEQKRTKKVTRTTSFAAIRKNGFTAIAKEVEKRFRKKRRAKTADNTEILQVKEEYERQQQAGTPKEGTSKEF